MLRVLEGRCTLFMRLPVSACGTKGTGDTCPSRFLGRPRDHFFFGTVRTTSPSVDCRDRRESRRTGQAPEPRLPAARRKQVSPLAVLHAGDERTLKDKKRPGSSGVKPSVSGPGKRVSKIGRA